MDDDTSRPGEWVVRTPDDLGRAVREFRRAAGLSQEQLAEQAGLHRTYVGGIERGERRLFSEALTRIVRRLGLEIVIRPAGGGHGRS